MRNANELINILENGGLDDRLWEIYVDAQLVPYQRKRYIDAISRFEALFCTKADKEAGEVTIFSAPGRSEIGGNHTDHQHGEVLVAAVNVDAIAVVSKVNEAVVKVISEGYNCITIDLNDLSLCESEKGTTTALIKGVLHGVKKAGFNIGGFNAYITSDVLIGAGLSSSAAFETLLGTIISGLYNEMGIPPVEIAKIGQYAENTYFGKPCGLMDQMASSVGNLVHIDFNDTNNPVIEKINCDFGKFSYSLCITDTKSSHADCTEEYAKVPREMKQVAAFFGKEYLRDVTKDELLSNVAAVRKVAGDRALLRAIHFVEENERVRSQVKCLKLGNFDGFLKLVKASGDSSYKYLQNVYMNSDVAHQNVSVALALSEVFMNSVINKCVDDEGKMCADNNLGQCALVCRVHGGGFAGTIQAFVKNQYVKRYSEFMNANFTEGACNVYHVRKFGGIKVL